MIEQEKEVVMLNSSTFRDKSRIARVSPKIKVKQREDAKFTVGQVDDKDMDR